MSPLPIRLLIAGCGDLGLRVALHILKNPTNKVWGLRRSVQPEESFPDGLNWMTADLSKPETLQNVPRDLTHVVFCAAPNARTEADYRAVYFEGLQNIVKSTANASLTRILFVSSTAVYGEHGNEWVDEDTPVEPKHFNGRVLNESEEWLKQYGLTHGVTTLSLRLSGIYGPGRTALLDKLKQGLVAAPSTPVHWANRIHVDDAARAVTHLMTLPNPKTTYLITDSTPLPMRTLYTSLAQLVGGPLPPEGASPMFVGSKRLSNARLLSSGFALNWPDSREGYASIYRSG